MTAAGEPAQDGDANKGDANDPLSSVQPLTSSVLAALASRGLDLPGVSRPADTGVDGDPVDAPRYTVLEQVARGGMGVIMRVRDEDLRRDLAMKVLDRAGREPDAMASDPRDLGRFLEEAQVTGQLDHPGVPPIHELGLDRDGRLFFTMKLVRGGTFLDVIQDVSKAREGWTVTRALGVVLKVCEALAYAHHKGVVHRDIKPANIMVGRFGETYVMDWGLAKVVDEGAAAGDGQPSYESLVSRSIVHTDRREALGEDGSTHATLDGDVVGTPAYMAPEQARGQIEALGPHSDIYAVGALLYHLIAGQAPYIEPGVRVSPHSVLRWVIDGPPKPLASLAPDAPAELVAIIDKAMAREPTLRYTNMLALAGDLQAFIEDRVVRAYQSGAWAEARKWVTRNKPLAAAAGLLLVVTVGALGAVSWVESSGRAKVEERNLLLGESNSALEDANAQLGQANTALEDKNVELADTNAALDKERAAAELARAAAEESRAEALANAERALTNAELAQSNADLAEASAREAEQNERRARTESYSANMTAAVAALDVGGGAAARRHLAACPEDLRGWDWRHLSLRADPSLHVWEGSESLLYDVVHSADGSLLATASGPFFGFGADVNEARILDATSGETLLSIPAQGSVFEVAFSPDARVLAFGADDYIVLWDIQRNRQLGSRHWVGSGSYSLEFLDNDRLLSVVAGSGGLTSSLEVRNILTQEVELSREANPAMTSASVSPDGTRLAVGHADHSVELLSLPQGKLLWRRPGFGLADIQSVQMDGLPGVTGLDFDAAGEHLVVAGRDQVLRLLDAQDGRELVQHLVEEGVPHSPRFHPDGPWVLVGDTSGSVRFLDAHTLDEIERLSGHDQVVLSLSISPDGDQLVSGDILGNLRVWDGRPGAASLMIANRAAVEGLGRDPGRRALEFSPDGRLVAWTPSIRAVLVADAITGEVLYRLAEVTSAIGGLAFSPDGREIHVQSEVEGLLSFDASDGRLLSTAPSGSFADWSTFDNSGSLLAMVESRSDTRIDLRVVENGVWAARLSGHEDSITSGSFTSDSQRFVSCSVDGSIRTWDLRSESEVGRIQTDDELLGLELYDGDRRALTTSLDPTRSGLSIWDLETGELIARHPARGLTLRGDLHPDGKLWAGTVSNGSVGLWNLERGEMFSLSASDAPILRTRFDPTGARLAALDRAGRLFLWDTVSPSDRAAARREVSHLARRVGESQALVDALVDEHLLMSQVLLALEADTALPADLREAAVREMRVRGDSGPRALVSIWERLLPADIPDSELASSPQTIAQAQAMLPILYDMRAGWIEYQDSWEPLVWALYVLGRHDEASALLPEGLELGYSFEPNGPQAMLVIQVLLTAASGDEDLARVQLVTARTTYEDAQRDAPGDVEDLELTGRLLRFAELRVGG